MAGRAFQTQQEVTQSDLVPPKSSSSPVLRAPQTTTTSVPHTAFSGSVVEAGPDHIVVHLGGRSVRVRLSPSTPIWKGDYDWGLPIEIGDDVAVRGWPQPWLDGFDYTEFEAERIWVNLTQVAGPVVKAEPLVGGLRLFLKHWGFTETCRQSRCWVDVSVLVDDRTIVEKPHSGVTFGEEPMAFTEGQRLRVKCLRLNDGSLLARRIILE